MGSCYPKPERKTGAWFTCPKSRGHGELKCLCFGGKRKRGQGRTQHSLSLHGASLVVQGNTGMKPAGPLVTLTDHMSPFHLS